MTFALCQLAHIPVRNTPSEKAEMTTQILFGEAFEVLDSFQNWELVRCLWDDYTGWISSRQAGKLILMDESYLSESYIMTDGPLAFVSNQNLERLAISFGSELRKGDRLFQNHSDHDPLQLDHLDLTDKTAALLHFVSFFKNAPYLWGGRSVFGIDCSGLIQIIHKALDIKLPRDAHQQAELGLTIDFIEESQPGDLAFFDNEDGKITHVGLLSDSKTVIHASGFVRFDPIDHHGIFNPQTAKYSHKLRIIKRLQL